MKRIVDAVLEAIGVKALLELRRNIKKYEHILAVYHLEHCFELEEDEEVEGK